MLWEGGRTPFIPHPDFWSWTQDIAGLAICESWTTDPVAPRRGKPRGMVTGENKAGLGPCCFSLGAAAGPFGQHLLLSHPVSFSSLSLAVTWTDLEQRHGPYLRCCCTPSTSPTTGWSVVVWWIKEQMDTPAFHLFPLCPCLKPPGQMKNYVPCYVSNHLSSLLILERIRTLKKKNPKTFKRTRNLNYVGSTKMWGSKLPSELEPLCWPVCSKREKVYSLEIKREKKEGNEGGREKRRKKQREIEKGICIMVIWVCNHKPQFSHL